MADGSISIVIKLNDEISSKLKSIVSTTQGCSKAMEELARKGQQLGDRYRDLTKRSAEAAAEALEVKRTMDDAAKVFKKTGDEADRLSFEKLKAQYNDLTISAKGYADEAKNTVKEIRALSDEVRKMDDAADIGEISAEGPDMAGSSGGLFSSFVSLFTSDDIRSGLMKSGVFKDLGNSVSGLLSAGIESAIGQPMATFWGQTVSGTLSGVASGAVAGVPGMVAGGILGTISGVLNGGTQIFQARDDAFKSYVQDVHEGQLTEQETSLTAGSSLAAGRETDRISFTQLFGDEQTADDYLSNMVDMANNTPFLYEDLKSMSKTLATYGFSAEEKGEDDYNAILPTLQTIGDAGAALGQSTSDMTAVATALGRMKSSDKTTLEYLNILNDRGIGAVGMLAEAKGVSQGDMYTMISKGEIAGTEAAEIILNAMADSFQGAMQKQSQTYSGLSSTVEGLSQELDNAMGEGYNEERKRGLADQRDWLSGDSGEAVMEANRAIGAWKADLENSKEQYIREAVDAMISSAEYQTAKEEGDAAEMGRLIMEAKVQGMNEYNASEGAQLALASEKALAEAIRDDTASNSDYWDAGYEKGQWFTKGLAAAIEPFPVTVTVDEQTGAVSYADKYDQSVDPMLVDIGGSSGLAGGTNNAFSKGGMGLPAFVGAGRIEEEQETKGDRSLSGVYKAWEAPGFSKEPANASPSGLLKDWKSHAYGLDYVPYDEFPALLHQGERVLTAAEARTADRGGGSVSVTVTGNEFHVREDSDVDAVAETLARKLRAAMLRGGG